MAALATQSIVYPQSTGPTFVAAAAGGDTAKAGDRTRLIVKNAGGAPVTVTIPRYPTTDSDGVAVAAFTVSVPATTGEKWIGPLYGTKFTNPATGNVEIAYSGVTSVTVAVITD